jgi:hypothetical protein
MTDDGALLQDYSESGSEVAFAQLVPGHLDFVYATARCGSSSGARSRKWGPSSA